MSTKTATIDTNSKGEIIARDADGNLITSKRRTNNPAALAQVISAAEMAGFTIDWDESTVAKPEADVTDEEISEYLSGLSAEARADWAAGRIDEVMTDHSTSRFGREINDQIKAVSASLREFKSATDSGSGAVKAASLEDAYQALRSKITDAQVDDGATLWVEDPTTGERMTMGKNGVR